MKRRILLTGAAGRIGRYVQQALADQYDWILTDQTAQKELGRTMPHPFHQADITDLAAMCQLCQGIDTVVHCAAASRLTAGWDEVLPSNLIGVYNILQAAVVARCRRVVFTSSYHTVYGYPADQPVQLEWLAYPVNLYGASKVWGEALAAVFAHQHSLSVICLRLGAVKSPDELRVGQANLAEVITDDDLMRLFVAAIEAPDTLHYGCFHGLSNNRYKRLDIRQTEQLLGYAPQDDAFALAQRNWQSWHWWRKRIQRAIRRVVERR